MKDQRSTITILKYLPCTSESIIKSKQASWYSCSSMCTVTITSSPSASCFISSVTRKSCSLACSVLSWYCSHSNWRAALSSAWTVKHKDPFPIALKLLAAGRIASLKRFANCWISLSPLEYLYRTTPAPTATTTPPTVLKLQWTFTAVRGITNKVDKWLKFSANRIRDGSWFFDNHKVIFYIILHLEGGWQSKAAGLGGVAKTWGLSFRLKAGIAGWKELVSFIEVESLHCRIGNQAWTLSHLSHWANTPWLEGGRVSKACLWGKGLNRHCKNLVARFSLESSHHFLIRKEKVYIYLIYIFKLQRFWKRVYIFIRMKILNICRALLLRIEHEHCSTEKSKQTSYIYIYDIHTEIYAPKSIEIKIVSSR